MQRRYRNYVTRRRTRANPTGAPVYTVTAADAAGARELLGLGLGSSDDTFRAYLRDARSAGLLLCDGPEADHYTRRVREPDGLHRRYVFVGDPLTAKRDLKLLRREPPEDTRVPRGTRVGVITWQ